MVKDDKRFQATSLLQDKLGDRVRTESSELYHASYDGLKIQGNTSACIEVDHTEQVGEVLKLADEFQVPVTTKGAGSSLTGGATPHPRRLGFGSVQIKSP